MQETAFVCLDKGNISSHAATMETFQMIKHRDSIFIRLFPQRFDSFWQPASDLPTIENTYEQLM
jgi:hypothetical protein